MKENNLANSLVEGSGMFTVTNCTVVVGWLVG